MYTRVTCDIFVFGDSFGTERPLCECVGKCRARSTAAMAHKNVEGSAVYKNSSDAAVCCWLLDIG